MTWDGGPRPALDEREQQRVVELMEWRRRRRAAGESVRMVDIASTYHVHPRTLYRYFAAHRRASSNTR